MPENNHVPRTAAICNTEQAWHTNIPQNVIAYSRYSLFVSFKISLQSISTKKLPSRIIDLLLLGSQAVWICDPAHDLCERNCPHREINRIRGKIWSVNCYQKTSLQKPWQQCCEFIGVSIPQNMQRLTFKLYYKRKLSFSHIFVNFALYYRKNCFVSWLFL